MTRSELLAGPTVHMIFVFFNKTSPIYVSYIEKAKVKVDGNELRNEIENCMPSFSEKVNRLLGLGVLCFLAI